MKINNNYKIANDVKLYLEGNKQTIDNFAKESGISKRTIINILNEDVMPNKETLEKAYSLFYKKGLRINQTKEEIFREINNDEVLFHGSKNGLNEIILNNDRNTCDFGDGFYLGENYLNALSFVCDYENSSVYSFIFNTKGLNIYKLDCDLDWLITICYYRGTIDEYKNNKKILKLIEKVEKSDVVIAPIADNRMFYIMKLFYEGEINDLVALHSLSASRLGLQYVFKSKKAINRINQIENHYLCKLEKQNAIKELINRTKVIDTKLKMAKREFEGKGKYIDELFK